MGKGGTGEARRPTGDRKQEGGDEDKKYEVKKSRREGLEGGTGNREEIKR